jgi:hypothetical protein
VAITKRFSIRHGIEAEPSEPVFEDAPKRVRFFVLQTLQNVFYYSAALKIVGRILCKPELIVTTPPQPWLSIQRCLDNCQWWEVYNLIEAMYTGLASSTEPSKATLFKSAVNGVFGQESIGWRMDENGHLQRLLPSAVNVEVERVFKELEAPRFSPALVLVRSAREAYNARPRSDLDVCTNIFDALESVAKEVFSVSGTFGDVLKKAKGSFSDETISTLTTLYALANHHYRHGTTMPFALKPAETDFVYVTCLAGIMLFVRSAP